MRHTNPAQLALSEANNLLAEQALALAVSHMSISSNLSKSKCRQLLSQQLQHYGKHHEILNDAPIITANESSFISALFSA